MKLPIVAIVGRPNVGKSSLFNLLAERRISIVDPTAGVTRDRIGTPLLVGDQYCELVDTGGMGIQDKDNLTGDIERQIQIAVNEAAVILFVVDVRDGAQPLDEHVAERLRVANKPVIFVANKADEPKLDVGTSDLFRLGYGEPICVSANAKRGREDLIFAIRERLPEDSPTDAPGEVELKIAIVGKRNVGKSTFINSLTEAERMIVSEVAGTTRDSVDVRFERDGKTFIAIDTAGVRKKTTLANSIEFYSMHRAERSIRRADVVLHFFDPRPRVSRVDMKLTEYILEQHKPAIFVVNKWDLAKDTIATQKWSDYLRKVFPMLDYVPIAFITAKEGRNVWRLLNLCQQLHKQAGLRATTGELNRVIREAMLANVPPVRNNKVPKVYYSAQVAVHPPTILMVTNGPELFDDPYIRHLARVLRDAFKFGEVPIKIMLKTKGETAGRGKPKEEPDDEEMMALARKAAKEELEFGDGDGTEAPEPVAAPPKPKKKPVVRKTGKKKKKPSSDTWNV
jgi:GTP-binding protein